MPPGRLFTLHRSCLAIKWPGGAWLFLSGMWPPTVVSNNMLPFQHISTAVAMGPPPCPWDSRVFPCPWPIVINCKQQCYATCDKFQTHFHRAVHPTLTKSVDVEVRTNGFKLDPLYFAYLLSSQLQMCLKQGHWHELSKTGFSVPVWHVK